LQIHDLLKAGRSANSHVKIQQHRLTTKVRQGNLATGGIRQRKIWRSSPNINRLTGFIASTTGRQ
jgi:hypothetical protein